MRLFLYIAALMLMVAITSMPYSYYKLLRLVAVVAFLSIVFTEYSRTGWNVWTTVAILGALVINPVFPIHLSKSVWQIVNPIMALIIGIYAYHLPKNRT